MTVGMERLMLGLGVDDAATEIDSLRVDQEDENEELVDPHILTKKMIQVYQV